ncbi:FAD/NAD(P)-binding domain-containing protein [Auricularia subglabra TFB-10046 SS5]|nr:FAD/NAD(P)-binding domain-containing protein [Auricularia subglabra TFB-10046 SS5]
MGPAGLAAAAKLGESGLSFAIVDAGKAVDERDRYSPEDATQGHGGAGLFSDGKFSFFPSASDLWSLPRDTDLRAAYDWTCDVLQAAGLDTPPFPDDPNAYSPAHAPGVEDWVLKAYPSDYLSLDGRLALVRNMVASCRGTVLSERSVLNVTYNASLDEFSVETQHGPSGEVAYLRARRLVLASGRFGPLQDCLRALTAQHAFRRLEVGFRIQQRSARAFFRDMRQLDPKLRIREAGGGVEWRTFCVCRRGETCLTRTGGLWTVSGRSDCPPTGWSNSGFNTRVFDEELATRAWAPLVRALGDADAHFEVSARALLRGDADAVATLDRIYGPELRGKMAEGLRRLAGSFEDLGKDNDAVLIGPTLEGVGWYPRVDGDLRLLDAPAWVAGDACGLFRGIVAAMISGHYAAASVLKSLETFRESPSCKVCTQAVACDLCVQSEAIGALA